VDLARYGELVDATPLTEFTQRLLADFRAGFDSALAAEWWRIMDVCLDMMSLGLLSRDFRGHPERREAWRVATDDERRDQFGIPALLSKIPDGEEIAMLGNSRADNMQEYIAHLREREVAMWTLEPGELSRHRSKSGRGDNSTWLATMTAEIIRHAMHAGLELLGWLLAEHEETQPEDFAMPLEDGAIVAFREEYEAWADEAIDRAAFEERMSRFSPPSA
jgi:hypothetical protein